MNSVPCERIFSKMGYVVTKAHSSLITSKAGLVGFVNANDHFASNSITRQKKKKARLLNLSAMRKKLIVCAKPVPVAANPPSPSGEDQGVTNREQSQSASPMIFKHPTNSGNDQSNSDSPDS